MESRYAIEQTEMGLKQQNRDWTDEIFIKQTETADRIGGQQTESEVNRYNQELTEGIRS